MNKLDDFFKKQLEDAEALPEKENWLSIASQLEGKELDAFTKSKMEDVEIPPAPEVWTNIKKELPLSLWVRNKLNWLSRIAAALVIFMVVSLYFNRNNSEEVWLENEINAIQEKEETASPSENTNFVFNINDQSKRKKISASEELLLEDRETIEKDFWENVMEEEEEQAFLIEVDNKVITKSLEPLLELPIENLEAAISPKFRLENKTNKTFFKKIERALIQYQIDAFLFENHFLALQACEEPVS